MAEREELRTKFKLDSETVYLNIGGTHKFACDKATL